jgi:hypothetical protein
MAVTYPTIRWSNGVVDSAPTWEELEAKVRDSQWWEYEPDEFRQAMAKRARVWSGTEIVTAGSSEAFFAELARAFLIAIETTTKEEV